MRDEKRGIEEKANMREVERESGLQEKGTELKGALGGETKAELKRVEEAGRSFCVPQKFSGWVSTMIQQLPPVGRAT
jgi:hypothetical protein